MYLFRFSIDSDKDKEKKKLRNQELKLNLNLCPTFSEDGMEKLPQSRSDYETDREFNFPAVQITDTVSVSSMKKKKSSKKKRKKTSHTNRCHLDSKQDKLFSKYDKYPSTRLKKIIDSLSRLEPQDNTSISSSTLSPEWKK
jgi:hypothetical protein